MIRIRFSLRTITTHPRGGVSLTVVVQRHVFCQSLVCHDVCRALAVALKCKQWHINFTREVRVTLFCEVYSSVCSAILSLRKVSDWGGGFLLYSPLYSYELILGFSWK